jgi:hypothetical protein
MSEDKNSTLSGISKASTLEKIAEFWDTHSLADYWDETRDVTFEVRANKKSADSHEPILQADDVLFQLSGAIDSGEGDLAEQHNHYLYAKPPQSTAPIRLFVQNSWSAREPEQQE